jgi:hypothetical protein
MYEELRWKKKLVLSQSRLWPVPLCCGVHVSLFLVNCLWHLASPFFSQHCQRSNNATQRACGVDWTTLMSPSELRQRFPWINTDGVVLGSFGEVAGKKSVALLAAAL